MVIIQNESATACKLINARHFLSKKRNYLSAFALTFCGAKKDESRLTREPIEQREK
jgi:hypothetical protein